MQTTNNNAPLASPSEALNDEAISNPTIAPEGWAVKLAKFPEALRSKRVWCVWRYQMRDNKATKVPYQATGVHPNCWNARSNDPSTWASFEDACAAADSNPELGVGIFCDGSFTFVDVDHCRNADTGEVEPWARKVLQRVGSYQEPSPSRTGLHAFAEGTISAAVKKAGVEMYCSGRFATVTGEGSGRYAPCHTLEAIRKDVVEGRAGKGTGLILARTSLTLAELEAGESPIGADGPDASEGDYQYVALLAEAGLSDEQIDERFQASARMRDKWLRNAGGGRTYGERTIAKVRTKQEAEEAKGNIDPDNWRVLFHTKAEAENAPPLKFAISNFLQEDGITFFGGLAGQGKTLLMLNTVRALLEGGQLFDYFKVERPSKRVLYLVPESGLGPFVHRLKLFRLMDHIGDRFFFRTLSSRDPMIGLSDPRILKAAEGADVFLDTAIRFMAGDENSASDHRAFAEMLFALQAAGARTIVGAHHSPKAFESRESITLESALRGSGDVGAMLATAWAVKQTSAEKNRLYIKNVKARDFDACAPFELEGRPWIDQLGKFQMVAIPGMAQAPSSPAAKKTELEEARKLRAQGVTLEDIAEQVGVTLRTVERWSSKGKLA